MQIAVGYIRVSTREQADSGLSLAAQRRRIQVQADATGLTLVDILEDAGASGKDMNRPALRELRARLSAGMVDCVIVTKLDRITRSMADMCRILEVLKKSRRADGGRGVGIVSCAETINTDTPAGMLALNMFVSFAQFERELTSSRTKDALAERRAQGKTVGGVVPFGFQLVPGTNGLMEANPRERRILQEAQELRRQGYSWEQTAIHLTRRGHRTRRGGAFSRQGIRTTCRKAGLEIPI